MFGLVSARRYRSCRQELMERLRENAELRRQLEIESRKSHEAGNERNSLRHRLNFIESRLADIERFLEAKQPAARG